MIALAIVALAVLLGQSPGSTAPALTASIEGDVVRLGSDEPIRGVRVELKPLTQTQSSGPAPVAFTDAQGHFLFSAASPGSYRMELAADGYARMQYGQRFLTGLEGTDSQLDPGTVLAVKGGEKVRGLVTQLTPTGSVSGSVRDANGRALAGLAVLLYKPVYSSDGKRTLTLVAQAQTDDHGAYRLYWITPESYFLAVGYPPETWRSNLRRLGESPSIPLRFFPAAHELAGATAVTVTPGAELTGMNMVVDTDRLYRISGRAINLSTGLPPFHQPGPLIIRTNGGPQYGVTLEYLSAGASVPMWEVEDNYLETDGSFEFQNVPPGTYRIGVRGGRPISVEIRSSDVEGLLLTIAETVPVVLNVTVEGKAAPSELRLNGLFALEDVTVDKLPGARRDAEVAPDGALMLETQPGTYRLIVGSRPGYYVKAARYRNKDALNGTIEISGKEPAELEIQLASDPGQIEGSILDASGRPGAGMMAILIPSPGFASPAEDRRHRIDLYQTTTADEDGHFVFRDVPPGGYQLYAWEFIAQYSWFDADVLAKYEMLGVPARVTAASKESVVLHLIPD